MDLSAGDCNLGLNRTEPGRVKAEIAVGKGYVGRRRSEALKVDPWVATGAEGFETIFCQLQDLVDSLIRLIKIITFSSFRGHDKHGYKLPPPARVGTTYMVHGGIAAI